MQMVKCPSCNEENPAKFRLCGYCGTPLAQATAALPPQELRKTVTLLFTDLKDSTVLGETLDSEAMHEVKERYFAAMSAEIERHGGKIEKYIGDAIMAVFGLPRSHEDDALRAVRAAVGMQKILAKLNKGLKARFGCELKNRTGVNTGEVVTTDDPTRDQKMATGDAVNVTARLEAAAPVNEILIGEVTYRLVRDAVQAEPVEPLTLKGKSQPVPAYKLIAVYGEDGNVRRHEMPVVGREQELAALETAWEEVTTQRQARLVTVIGDAGVGKTRLVREIMDRLSSRGARILSGRALPYGDGITYWPLRGMVLGAATIHQDDTPEQAQEKILACVRDRDVADRLASAVGLSSTAFSMQDIAWAARRFLQTLAAEAPIVALFDDIHWAEPAFLDLMENLLDSVEGAPVLMLGTSRHDLLESRATWSDRPRARRLVLQPLSDEAVAQVIHNLLGGAGLPDAFVRRVVAAAEGNPLYVEQMLSMLVDNGVVQQVDGAWVAAGTDGEISIPPTIQALLEARLDKLERGERAAAEPASVIGMEFQRPALQSIAPAAVRDVIDEKLQALSRKHFIRQSVGAEGEAKYRFDHHMVRETVYNGLLKRARATMHAEFVKWADQSNAGSDRGREFEEILGYHLEQAYKYLAELGPIDDAGAALGRDGAKRLGSAARRALARGDMHAAAGLFKRAAALLPIDDDARLDLLPELAEALMGLGDFAGARQVLAESRQHAEANGNTRIAASSRLISTFVRVYSRDKSGESENPLQLVDEVVPMLEREGAHNELATAWRLQGMVHGVGGAYLKATEAAEKSLSEARLAGNERLAAKAAGFLGSIALYGPMPVCDAVAQCEKAIQEGLSDRQVEASLYCMLASLRAMNGEVPVARSLYQRGRDMLRDLGEGVRAAASGIHLANLELHGGDLGRAEQEMKADFDFLKRMDENYHLSSIAALLGKVVREQGRDNDALPYLKTAEELSSPNDVTSQAFWRSMRAPILARQGQLSQAEDLAREAVEMLRTTECPGLQADALVELASVLTIADRIDEAKRVAEEAIALYRVKGDIAFLCRWTEWAETAG
jgi:class 3 adenylate cyclase/tetratricopeptide (TPR) repeat protein